MGEKSPGQHGAIAVLLIVFCTAIGFWIYTEENEMGVVNTWFWAGIGLAGIYLLSVIAENLDQI